MVLRSVRVKTQGRQQVEINLERAKKDILTNFDFDFVHTVMAASCWRWALSDGYRVPTVDELRVYVLSLVREAFNDFSSCGKMAMISGGGFSVMVFESGDVKVDFVIESCLVQVVVEMVWR